MKRREREREKERESWLKWGSEAVGLPYPRRPPWFHSCDAITHQRRPCP